MTPAERCARLGTAYDPSAWPLDPAPPDLPDPVDRDYGRIERRLAIVFAMLAAAAIGFGVGAALP